MNNFISFSEKNNIAFLQNEPLAKHSTFRIGKNALLAIFPDTTEKIIDTVRFFKESGEKFLVLGKGSNVLFPDYDIEYPIIFTERAAAIEKTGENTISAEAGATLSRVASFGMSHNLGGFEFASGIPGTVGGAVVMNAGAYGKNISDVLVKTEYLGSDGEIHTITNKEHLFGYRKSVFTAEDIVLRSEFMFENKSAEEITAEISTLSEKRRTTQPLEYPSAGSVFKRPEGWFVGKMVDECGLKGLTVGGAQVSKKHSGFIINIGGATSEDVKNLVSAVQEKVYEKFGVKLEREIRYID